MSHKTDIEIAREAKKIMIQKVAEKLDIPNTPYARAMSQKGRGGFSKEGVPP